MKLKLTFQQLQALHLMVAMLLDTYDSPRKMAEKLVYEIVCNIEVKTGSKVHAIERGSTTTSSVKLTTLEAKAFYIWYLALIALVPADSYQYERIVCDRIINEIDKVFS